ncbi:hypothetical protein ACP4OV_004319 [Aristida adscensionis]
MHCGRGDVAVHGVDLAPAARGSAGAGFLSGSGAATSAYEVGGRMAGSGGISLLAARLRGAYLEDGRGLGNLDTSPTQT